MSLKILTRDFLAITVLLAVVGAPGAHGQSLTDRADKDDLAYMQDEEPAMRRAFERARASLDDFMAKAKRPPRGTRSYAVKVGVHEGADTEYFWVNELKVDGERYTGRINNEPRMVTSVRYGQAYSFSKNEIVDWTYIDDTKGRTMGNFTACALLTKEPRDEAEAFKKRYGLTCD